MATRPQMGSAEIRYWGGIERSGESPRVLVYDDGSTNGGKPVWRKKMTAAAVIKAHENGKMFPLNSCPYSKNSRCASVEDLHAIVEGRKVTPGKPIKNAVLVGVGFPWDEDAEEITRVLPKDYAVQWSEAGEFVAATFRSTVQSQEFVISFDRSSAFSVKAADGSEVNPRVFNMDEKCFALFCEWISFHRNKMSFKDFKRNIRSHYRFTSVCL